MAAGSDMATATDVFSLLVKEYCTACHNAELADHCGLNNDASIVDETRHGAAAR